MGRTIPGAAKPDREGGRKERTDARNKYRMHSGGEQAETYMLREASVCSRLLRNSFPDLGNTACDTFRDKCSPHHPRIFRSALSGRFSTGAHGDACSSERTRPLFPISPISSAFFGSREPEKFVSISSEYGSALRSWLKAPAAGGYAADERRVTKGSPSRVSSVPEARPRGTCVGNAPPASRSSYRERMAGSCAACLADPVFVRGLPNSAYLFRRIGFYFRRLAAEEEAGDPRTENFRSSCSRERRILAFFPFQDRLLWNRLRSRTFRACIFNCRELRQSKSIVSRPVRRNAASMPYDSSPYTACGRGRHITNRKGD